MKVKVILKEDKYLNGYDFPNIKRGKIYDTDNHYLNQFYYLICDELGIKSLYLKKNFYTIDELRDKKLKDLGI